MKISIAQRDAQLRKRHRAMQWTLFETSTPWAYVHPVLLGNDRALFESVGTSGKVPRPDALVVCFNGGSFGPIAFGVALPGKPLVVPAGAIALGERPLLVRGEPLRLGPFPLRADPDEDIGALVIPCPFERVMVSVSQVPYEPDEPSDGWLHVAVRGYEGPVPAATDVGTVINCEL